MGLMNQPLVITDSENLRVKENIKVISSRETAVTKFELPSRQQIPTDTFGVFFF